MSTVSDKILQLDGELPPNSPLRDVERLDVTNMKRDDPVDLQIAGRRLALLKSRLEIVGRIISSDACPSGGLLRLEYSDCAMEKRGHRMTDVRFEQGLLHDQILEIKTFLKQGTKS